MQSILPPKEHWQPNLNRRPDASVGCEINLSDGGGERENGPSLTGQGLLFCMAARIASHELWAQPGL
ncbi:unnamed protein product [Gadus morhua 'NCC']